MKVKIHKKLPKDITGTKLLYKYKNIRIYRCKKDGILLKYWVSILLLGDGQNARTLFYTGKLLPFVDIRSLPTWNSAAHEKILSLEAYKLVPKLFRDAVRLNAILEEAYVDWDETMEEYLIEEV